MTPTDDSPASGQRSEPKTPLSESRHRREAPAKTSAASGSASGSASARAAGTTAASPRRRATGTGEVTIDDRVRVLVGPAQPFSSFGVSAPGLEAIIEALEGEPDVDVLHRIAARPPVQAVAGPDTGAPAVVSAEMPAARAAALGQYLHLVVEVDAPLEPATWAPVLAAPPGDDRPFYGSPLPLTVVVTDPDGRGVEGALVRAFTRRGPTSGLTDAKGRVELMVLDTSAESVGLLTVVPARDHWSRWIPRPRLDADKPNTVVIEPLAAFLHGFGEKEHLGWGLRAMRIDHLPSGLEGRGVKIAVVDSGAARHPDLPSPSTAFDLVTGKATGWNEDTLAHGTHALGVIAGGRSGVGVRGIAPEAEIVVYKVLPGGRCSSLIEALDRCIEEQVDVVHLGLCAARPSALVEQRLQRARRLGIACIAAAGHTLGPVAYPAASPAVLAVGAAGRFGEFPSDSHHALDPVPGVPVGPDGFFAAGSSPWGPEIDLCGPGVAVVSTVAPGGYAAWDGTSPAAAHVSGLAALLLAHHPDFDGPFRPRTAARVDRLFDILRRCVRPLPFGDPRRTGAGLPDALLAFGGVIAPAGVGWSPTPLIDPTSWLGQPAPAPAPHRAGFANANGGNGHGRAGRAGADTDAALARLRESLERAGIYR